MIDLTQDLKIVPVLRYQDLTGGADMYTDSINMKNYHRATFIIQWHALGVADIHLWAYSGTADATYDSTLPFKYAFGGGQAGAASCDVLTDWTSNLSTGTPAVVHILNGTYDNFIMVVQVDASDMDIANQEEWLALDLADTDTNATGNVTIIAILEPRYKEAMSATALT